MTNIQEVLDIVEKAKGAFATQLQELATRGGLTKEMYVRNLTFQYHPTKGVQRHFFKVAGHPRLSGKAGRRNFYLRRSGARSWIDLVNRSNLYLVSPGVP